MPKRGGRFSGGINFGGIGINFGGSRPLPRPRARSPGPSGFKRSTSKNTAAPSRPMKAPTKKSLPPKQAPAGWGIGGLGSRIMHGMALFFVAGSEMAHRAIGGMMGGKEESKEIKGEDGGAVMQGDGAQGAAYDNQAYSNPCMEFTNKLAQCLKDNSGEIGICQFNMNQLKECETQYLDTLNNQPPVYQKIPDF